LFLFAYLDKFNLHFFCNLICLHPFVKEVSPIRSAAARGKTSLVRQRCTD
jgi:hypothetical protein